jgi:catechol 2,3-dioxygenase-like lactoylglutathione lyase family enzyme
LRTRVAAGHATRVVLSVPPVTVAPMTEPAPHTPTGPPARLQVVALDCPDPGALAAFYAAVLGTEIEDDGDADWVQLAPVGGTPLAFQRVPDHRPPQWPGAEHPQQMHLDLEVDDLDAGEAAVVALGARKHEVQPGETFRVFLDPAGHPFCLVTA